LAALTCLHFFLRYLQPGDLTFPKFHEKLLTYLPLANRSDMKADGAPREFLEDCVRFIHKKHQSTTSSPQSNRRTAMFLIGVDELVKLAKGMMITQSRPICSIDSLPFKMALRIVLVLPLVFCSRRFMATKFDMLPLSAIEPLWLACFILSILSILSSP
jgi:hypothetical protein